MFSSFKFKFDMKSIAVYLIPVLFIISATVSAQKTIENQTKFIFYGPKYVFYSVFNSLQVLIN